MCVECHWIGNKAQNCNGIGQKQREQLTTPNALQTTNSMRNMHASAGCSAVRAVFHHHHHHHLLAYCYQFCASLTITHIIKFIYQFYGAQRPVFLPVNLGK